MKGCLMIGGKKECKSFTGILGKGGEVRKYENGVYHREEDLPARVTERGAMVWYVNGKMKRSHGLPCLITDSGSRVWFKEDSKGAMSEDRSITLEALGGALVIGFKEIVG